jgi:hypothetical protein
MISVVGRLPPGGARLGPASAGLGDTAYSCVTFLNAFVLVLFQTLRT